MLSHLLLVLPHCRGNFLLLPLFLMSPFLMIRLIPNLRLLSSLKKRAYLPLIRLRKPNEALMSPLPRLMLS
uniref:Uncharacterized protein n=1 Tax=Picea glauca TaxID=3330 RepID=A0A101M4N2_PICGL|nr:hypothetical protein ABT39_MTgene781 [Picea glauca]QHR90500.1 hypothetical protein Q903MT_gene4524 [Picea sitchensis]